MPRRPHTARHPVRSRSATGVLGDGQIVRFGPAGTFFGNYRRQETINWNNGNHVVVVLNGRVYDAFTPKGGESIAEYKAQWDFGDIIDFGF